MNCRIRMASVAAFSVLAGGCGTICSYVDNGSLPANKRAWIYSGVRFDVEMVRDKPEVFSSRTIGLFALDIPLSVCADTVCLPYSAVRAIVGPGQR